MIEIGVCLGFQSFQHTTSTEEMRLARDHMYGLSGPLLFIALTALLNSNNSLDGQ